MDSEEITILVIGVACLAGAVALSFGPFLGWTLLLALVSISLLGPLLVISLVSIVIRVAEYSEQKSISPDQKEEEQKPSPRAKENKGV